MMRESGCTYILLLCLYSTQSRGEGEAAEGWEPKTITEVFQHTKTDKLHTHGYHRYYERELLPYRDLDKLHILEIGAAGGGSLRAWLDYFKDPEVVTGVAYGVDPIAAHKTACIDLPKDCEKVQIYSIDQSNASALNDMKRKNPEGWHIIIDDGSHVPEHQSISLEELWPAIRPGGLYVIEDIETSYWEHTDVYTYHLNGGIGKPASVNFVERAKQLVDTVNRRHFGHEHFTVMNGVDADIARVTFGDGIIFLEKKPADVEWDKYPSADLRTAHHYRIADGPVQEYLAKLRGTEKKGVMSRLGFTDKTGWVFLILLLSLAGNAWWLSQSCRSSKKVTAE